MRNIFLLYMPPGNAEAMIHYEETILRPVEPSRIYRYVGSNLRRQLDRVFGSRPIAVWGSRDSGANRSKFDRMKPGDEVLIVEGDTIRLLGKVAAMTINPELSRELWKNIRGDNQTGWDLIYFIANPVEINLPFVKLCQLLDYRENYQLRGFTAVSAEKLEAFYDRYDDLYSILFQIKHGRPIYEKPKAEELDSLGDDAQDTEVPVEQEDVEAVLSNGALSDHVKMQWKLIELGLKCGSKVWIPVSDQKKIREQYDFGAFETNFAAGLDTQTRYVENIDVVYKDEFRIDAAFEIENTTSIYSGLLRFADLSLVAPNTTYPFFIVAPREKRHRLIEQLRRPAFKHLHLSEKVRYLSYDAIDEIDEFTANLKSGLSVELIKSKAECFERSPP